MIDGRLAASIAAALRGLVDDVNRRRIAPEIAIARGVERLMEIIESIELPAERIRRENDEASRQMAALGNRRDAASLVARRWSNDPHAQEILAQRFRRLRRIKNKRALLVSPPKV